MILYFSATGNSAYTAKRIGKEIGDEACNLFEKIREHDVSDIYSEKPWVVVCPTYAWRIPRVLESWLTSTKLKGNQDIYFIMTCAGGVGNAGAYINQLCAAKGMNFLGCIPVIMPENYIAVFTSPGREEALKIINKAEGSIDKASQLVKNKEKYVSAPITFMDRISSGVVNHIYYPAIVHAKKFYATDACISCGKCEKLCPLKNIRLENGKPLWGGNCTHCMACICRCPANAIEYGKHTKGAVRYTCPKTI